mmetsp:Transcript_45921/g.147893  ORF Transcript_45921/g.147893 Transcript_45921/m.147893 type:complete len:191 (-) Transcript_45921:601-1173(-)
MPVVVCGPSGVGKGTLLTRLTAAHPSRFGFCVSHTTRSPRPGETDGVHYHFCNKAHMEAAIERGEFLEYARVHSNLYGTSFAAVRTVASRGKTCLLDIDVQGAESVKRSSMEARFLFIAPPNLADLERRLRDRGTETEDKVRLRMSRAKHEISYTERPGFFDDVVVNDDLERAYSAFESIMLSHADQPRP